MDIDILASRLDALGNPTRLQVFRALVRAGLKGLPVGALQDRLGIAPSTLSHHLGLLVRVGLVRQVRQGTTLQCHADYLTMTGIVTALQAECCAEDGPGQ